MRNTQAILDRALSGQSPSVAEALNLASSVDTDALLPVATTLRDSGFGNVITYSKKVFIPLTHLCRDVCHYCTFAQAPKKVVAPYLQIDEVLETCRAAAELGCKEALFTLGEKPEQRYKTARDALAAMGYRTTTDYLHDVAEQVFRETGLLPHLNPGTLSFDELCRLRRVSPSMGLMLESTATRLTEKGTPHYGSPDKAPAVRLQTLREAGRARIPFTTGILVGIGETRVERIESLLAIREAHRQHGHIQEIIIQNFRAKPGTKMVDAPEPARAEMIWTIALARVIFGARMSIQAPPNLSPDGLAELVNAGINDWGGVSPLTPDFVNPEAPWPEIERLAAASDAAGKYLQERLTVYPTYIHSRDEWLDERFRAPILHAVDSHGLARIDPWHPGDTTDPPPAIITAIDRAAGQVSTDVAGILARAQDEQAPSCAEIERLFNTWGADFSAVCQTADALRARVIGDSVTYVVNRNINYTNVCYFKCQFCAFSKGKLSENLRGKPYDLSHNEIARRVREAWDRGATEVCMQGGIHPQYTGATYLEIVRTVKAAAPGIHVSRLLAARSLAGRENLGSIAHGLPAGAQRGGLGYVARYRGGDTGR